MGSKVGGALYANSLFPTDDRHHNHNHTMLMRAYLHLVAPGGCDSSATQCRHLVRPFHHRHHLRQVILAAARLTRAPDKSKEPMIDWSWRRSNRGPAPTVGLSPRVLAYRLAVATAFDRLDEMERNERSGWLDQCYLK